MSKIRYLSTYLWIRWFNVHWNIDLLPRGIKLCKEGGLTATTAWNKVSSGRTKCLLSGFVLLNPVINNKWKPRKHTYTYADDAKYGGNKCLEKNNDQVTKQSQQVGMSTKNKYHHGTDISMREKKRKPGLSQEGIIDRSFIGVTSKGLLV